MPGVPVAPRPTAEKSPRQLVLMCIRVSYLVTKCWRKLLRKSLNLKDRLGEGGICRMRVTAARAGHHSIPARMEPRL